MIKKLIKAQEDLSPRRSELLSKCPRERHKSRTETQGKRGIANRLTECPRRTL